MGMPQNEATNEAPFLFFLSGAFGTKKGTPFPRHTPALNFPFLKEVS